MSIPFDSADAIAEQWRHRLPVTVLLVGVRRCSMFIRRSGRWGLSLALAAGLAACAPNAPVSESDMARAAGALEPLKTELRSALMGALEEGGPERAIEVCQLRAPEIAHLTRTGGAVVGRTSHRVRNPENAPQAWMSVFLEEYLANPDDDSGGPSDSPRVRSGSWSPST